MTWSDKYPTRHSDKQCMLTESDQECCFEAEPDALVGMIKAGQVEPYGTLDKFVS